MYIWVFEEQYSLLSDLAKQNSFYFPRVLLDVPAGDSPKLFWLQFIWSGMGDGDGTEYFMKYLKHI